MEVSGDGLNAGLIAVLLDSAKANRSLAHYLHVLAHALVAATDLQMTRAIIIANLHEPISETTTYAESEVHYLIYRLLQQYESRLH